MPLVTKHIRFNKLCFAAIILLCLAVNAAAQENFGITGKVVDSLNHPFDNSVVTLVKGAGKTLVKSTFTEPDGNYSFSSLHEDTFQIVVYQLGYKNYVSDPIILNASQPQVNFPEIVLKSSGKNLSEVTVTSALPFVERKLDRTIVNPDALISNAGSNALEVLAKAPGVIIDGNGAIKLKGKSGVVVFIDDKSTYLSGADLENYLKSLPASTIKQIEIMTNPPAKYDASGNAGIINIKTKKNKLKGINGGVSATYSQGRYARTSDNFSLNFSNQKITIFSNLSYSSQTYFQDLTIHRRYKNSDLSTKSLFNQNTYIKAANQAYNARLGFDYYINNSTTIGVSTKALLNQGNVSKYNKAQLLDSNEVLSNKVLADNSERNIFKNGSVNVNLRHQFDSTGKQLIADLDYVAYASNSNQTFKNDVLLTDGTNIYNDSQSGKLPSQINIYAFKCDYENPLKNNAKFDLGIKTSYTKTDNESIYTITQNDITQDNYNLSNHFKYDEMINAAYGNFTKSFSRIDIQAGLRFESTVMNGYQLGNILKPASEFKRTYNNVFPTLYASFKLDSALHHILVFSYGKRINRPFYRDLNPFVRPLDKYTYYAGNPYVQPTFAHNLSLAHSYKNFLTTTISYNNTINNIQETIEINNGIYYSRPGNIGSSEQFNLSLESSIPFAKWLNTNLYSEVVYSRYKSQLYTQTLNTSGTYWFISANNSFILKKGWSAELSGQYISSFIDSQFLFGDFGFITLGLQKKILKDKGSIKTSLSDVLYTNRIRGTINNLELTDANWYSLNDSRVFSLTFSYRFGKNTNSKPRHTTNGSETEQSRVKSS